MIEKRTANYQIFGWFFANKTMDTVTHTYIKYIFKSIIRQGISFLRIQMIFFLLILMYGEICA